MAPSSYNRMTQRLGKSQFNTLHDILHEADTTTDFTYPNSSIVKHLPSTDSTTFESLQRETSIVDKVYRILQWLRPFGSNIISDESIWSIGSTKYPLQAMRVVVWGAKRSGKSSIIYRWKLDSFIPTVPTIGLLEEGHEHFNSALRCNVRLNLYEIGRDPVSVEMRAIPIQKDYPDSASDSDDEEVSKSTGVTHEVLYGQSQRCRRRRKRYRDCCATISKCCRCIFCAKRRARSQAIDFAVHVWSKIVKKANAVVYVVDSSCKVSLLEMFDDLNLILHNDHLKSQNARFLILANKQDVWGAVSATEIERMLNIPRQMEMQCKVLPCSALTGENLSLALNWLEEWMLFQCPSLQLSTTSSFS